MNTYWIELKTWTARYSWKRDTTLHAVTVVSNQTSNRSNKYWLRSRCMERREKIVIYAAVLCHYFSQWKKIMKLPQYKPIKQSKFKTCILLSQTFSAWKTTSDCLKYFSTEHCIKKHTWLSGYFLHFSISAFALLSWSY